MSDVRKLKLVPVPPLGAEDHARAETERNRALFAWADALLAKLGLLQAIAAASTLDGLRKVILDVDRAEVELAVRDALHPANGRRAADFDNLKAGALKRILRLRFGEAKTDRAKEISRDRGAGATHRAFDWTSDLILDKHGAVRPLLANLVLFLQHHPAWNSVLGFDQFNVRVVIRKSPPWGTEAPDVPWSDNHESLARVWFQHEGVFAGLSDVGRAVQAAARSNPFHPVRDYFNELTWDGTPRLGTWLQTYFHVEDSEYVRAIAPRWLISVPARIFDPGCQVDHAIILEGSQGRLKSEALRALVPQDVWFTDRISPVSTKDAALETAGVLIIELAELDALIRASSSASKSFLTRRVDRLRLPYGRHQVRLPRQCVFAGTINPPAGGYLKDSTGARRFWPVTCQGRIDVDALRRDRDQLWAEAVHRHKANKPWWLETAELEALATAEQRARYITDIWQVPVEEWLDGQKEVTIPEVLTKALHLAPQEHSQRNVNRVSAILTHAGFVRVRARIGAKRDNQRETRYRRES